MSERFATHRRAAGGVPAAGTRRSGRLPVSTTSLFGRGAMNWPVPQTCRMVSHAAVSYRHFRTAAELGRLVRDDLAVKPHRDLGRAGTVCPFVPGSSDRKVLWLAPERITSRGEPDVVQLMNGYKRLLLQTQPTSGDDADYKVIVVVFTDLPADRAQGVFGDVLQQLAVPSYADDGILFGPYYEGNEQTAIHNPGFRPFQSPVPFLFVRPGVIGDWEFFVDNDEWLGLWACRYRQSAVQALAEALRRTNWRQLD